MKKQYVFLSFVLLLFLTACLGNAWPDSFDPENNPNHCIKTISAVVGYQGVVVPLGEPFDLQIVGVESAVYEHDWYVYNSAEYDQWADSTYKGLDIPIDHLRQVLAIPEIAGGFYSNWQNETNRVVYSERNANNYHVYSNSGSCPSYPGEIGYDIHSGSHNGWDVKIDVYEPLVHVVLSTPAGSYLDWNMPYDLFVSMWTNGVSYGELSPMPTTVDEFDFVDQILSENPTNEVLAYRFLQEDNTGRTELFSVLQHAVLVNASLYEGEVTPLVLGEDIQSQELHGTLHGRFGYLGRGSIDGEINGWTTVVVHGNIFLP